MRCSTIAGWIVRRRVGLHLWRRRRLRALLDDM